MAFLMTVELLEAALRLAAPIGFAAIGELVVQRSGVINVGLEGIMLAGAFAGYAAGSSSGEIWVGVSGAILIGSVLAACFAWVTIYKRGDQIVTGMAFNLLLLGLTGVAMQSLYSGDLQIAPQVEQFRWLGVAILEDQTVFSFLLLLVIAVVGAFLKFTRPGLLLRAVGESAVAAEVEGVDVLKVRTLAIIFGGAMAGLGGAVLTLSDAHVFSENMTAGRGFIALAIVIFGGWRASGVLAAALFFGAAHALQFRLQAEGFSVSYPLWLMFPYVATILALTVSSKRNQGPSDLGRPYRRD